MYAEFAYVVLLENNNTMGLIGIFKKNATGAINKSKQFIQNRPNTPISTTSNPESTKHISSIGANVGNLFNNMKTRTSSYIAGAKDDINKIKLRRGLARKREAFKSVSNTAVRPKTPNPVPVVNKNESNNVSSIGGFIKKDPASAAMVGGGLLAAGYAGHKLANKNEYDRRRR
jgi:hypothetical protein